MAEFRVRFVGDLGNLAAFNAAIRNSLSSNAATLERANSQVVSRAIGERVQAAGSRGSGLFVRNAVTEIDRLNNSFIQSGTVVRRYTDGFTTEMRKVNDATTGLTYNKAFARPTFGEAYHSDFKKAVGNVEAYEKAIARLAPIEKQFIAAQGTATRRLADISNVQAQVGTYGNLAPALQTEKQRQALFKNVNRLAPGLIASPADFQDIEGSLAQTVSKIQGNLHQQRVTIQRSLRDELRAIQSDPVVKQISEQAFYAATSPEGRLGREATNVLNRYPQVRRDLEQKAGLGGGNPFLLKDQKTINPAYAIAAQSKDFEITNVSRDMERGLTRVSGAIRDTDGVMSQWNYTIDKNNNAVNTWGRGLSGARGFLNQTTRDLIKVVEWTVATTAVFGALGIAISGFSKINDLNVNLQRFAITARLSNTELDAMFKGLSQVAFATATPIGELVKAADDMALATRRANQSTQEWQASILELATAVGILTNISGIDTVKATELLVASMKQLNLQTGDLVPLLSQITAAAGGQSGSITDIASALAVLAEAAEGALIPLEGQIAAVQVISQVTGKSADQTANAFKNLFGAINSDSSVKKLEEFGIAVRDAEGNLLPFLDIYRDIADAINTGLIPEGRVNEVLRAISGGRTGRQADTAALIANIYKVFEVQDIAATASNEALIANAKILDTNQAKLTRFQNTFDILVFEKFNEVVADLTATLADLGTVFAAVFGGIPTQVITITVEILALAAAIKLLSKAGSALNLGALFGGIKNNIVGAAGTVQNLGEFAGRPPVIPGAQMFSLLSEEQQAVAIANRNYRSTPLGSRGVSTTPYDTTRGQMIWTQQNPQNLNTLPFIGVPPRVLSERDSRFWPENVRYGAQLRAPDLERGPGLRQPLPLINLEQRLKNIGIAPIQVDTETKSLLQRFIGVFNSKAGKFGAGALAGGAVAASGGELSGVAQAVGTALLFNPATAPVGAGLLVGGLIADQFSEKAEEAKTRALDLQTVLYNLTLQWKQDAAAVQAAQITYNTINTSLKKAEEGSEKYIQLQGQLAEATVVLALALDTQANSTREIIKSISELNTLSGGKSPELSSFASGLVGQQLSQDQLRELIGIVSGQILAASGQPVFTPTTGSSNFDPKNLNYTPPTNDPIRIGNSFGGADEFTPEQFVLDSTVFDRFLKEFQGSFTAENFPFQNPAAVAAFSAAAEAKRLTLPPEQQLDFLNNVINPFREAVAQFAIASTQVNQAIQNARANVEARQLLGLLSGPQAEASQANLAAAESLQGRLVSPNLVTQQSPAKEFNLNPSGGVNISQVNETIEQLLANSLTGTFDADLFEAASQQILQSLGVWDDFGGDQLAETTAEATILREVFHLTDDEIIKVVGSLGTLGSVAEEELQIAIDATNDWADNALAAVGQKLLDLQARFQGGEFDKDPIQYKFLKDQFEAEAESILKVRDATNELQTTLGGDATKAAEQMLNALTKLQINGFQGVEANLQSLNGAFFTWINTLNLSDKQMQRVVTRWITMMGLAAQAVVLLNSTAALSSGIYNGTAGPSSISSAYSQQQAVQKQIANLLKQIKNIGGNAPGTSTPTSITGSSGGGGTGRSVDTLYLSEEQAAFTNDPQELVRQAYRDALKLQKQIPGEEKRNRKNTVIVFDELNRIFKAKGVSEELLRRALDNLTGEMEKANQKADVVRRIRVGAGDFSAIANVPLNSATGVSVGANNQINVTFNLGGTNLTPAQFEKLANMIGAEIARRL